MARKLLLIIGTALLVASGAIYYIREKNAFENAEQPLPVETGASEHSDEDEEKIEMVDFTLSDIDGNKVNLSDYKGKKIFLNFWATWCPPCRAEMPDIEKLYQETKDSDLVIIAVNSGDSADEVGDFIKKNKYNFKILLDTNSEVSYIYSATSIPTSYFIDEDGYIRYGKKGLMTLDEMKAYIDALN